MAEFSSMESHDYVKGTTTLPDFFIMFGPGGLQFSVSCHPFRDSGWQPRTGGGGTGRSRKSKY
ncbi:hypothetical protein GCM10009414_20280 [Tatumella terrea]